MKKIMHLFFVVFIFLSSAGYGMNPKKTINFLDENAVKFIEYAERGKLAKVIELLKMGINPNAQVLQGFTALFAASQNGHIKVVQELLNAGAEVDLETWAGHTALHAASREGCTEVVKLLLAAGADIYWQDPRKNTPLHFAKQKGHTEIVNFFQEQIERDELEARKARLAKRKTW